MNRWYLLLILMIIAGEIFSQEKGDYVWMFGRLNPLGNPFFSGCTADFNFSPPEVFQEDREISFEFTNASVCDDEGDLLFYTNGRFIAQSNHQIMYNGEDLNLDYLAGPTNAMKVVQGALILQNPADSFQYFVFHSGLDILDLPDGLQVVSRPFFYSKVDFNISTFPDGYVVNKNIELSLDTFDIGKVTATRHANGRDWWLLLSKWETNEYYRFFISPNGIENLGTQEVGTPSYAGLGQAAFTPNGSKYAKLSLRRVGENYLDIYDFDRCTGFLSNHQQLLFTDAIGAGGLSISPSSQYLYLITTLEIKQFDLWADDVFASQETVAVFDGFQEIVYLNANDSVSVPTNFFMGQLGPDNKIYICSPNSVSSLTVINQPDLSGIDCDVQQHSFSLPALNDATIPNFPNYRLGALEGSPCDTLNFVNATEELLIKRDIQIYPNPTSGGITIQISSEFSTSGKWVLYNQLGQIVDERVLETGQTAFDISLNTFAKGIYFYSVFEDAQLVGSGKVILE